MFLASERQASDHQNVIAIYLCTKPLSTYFVVLTSKTAPDSLETHFQFCSSSVHVRCPVVFETKWQLILHHQLCNADIL